MANQLHTNEQKPGVYARLKAGISGMWSKTIFPDMLKRRREEKELIKNLQHEARLEALKELGPELKKVYKQQALDKLTGKKKGDMMQKLADGFKMGDGGGIGSTEKISQMLGTGSTGQGMQMGRIKEYNNMLSSGNNNTEDKIKRLLGTKKDIINDIDRAKKMKGLLK